jgi:hypothetical protein
MLKEVLQRMCKNPEYIWTKYEKPQLISVRQFRNRSQTFFFSIAAILAHLYENGLMILVNTELQPM